MAEHAQDALEYRSRSSSAVLFYGAVWGLLEATLGYGLHVLARATPLPPLAGFVLFPIGVAAMVAAVRVSGRPAAAFGVAIVAASIKASSAVLPAVGWVFIQNPTVAILLEGLVVWGFVALFGFGRIRRAVGSAIALAFGAGVLWRVLFALFQIGFGIRWGLLARGLPAVLGFILLDSAVNGAIILCMLRSSLPARLATRTQSLLRPFPAALALAAAFAAELVTSVM